jgi:UDP-glucose 4-epimerase
MNLLITGGTGFVMSVVAREWLERHPDRRAVILDRAGLDTTAQTWFAPVRERLTVVEGDVRDPSGWSAELDRHEITAVWYTVLRLHRFRVAVRKRRLACRPRP